MGVANAMSQKPARPVLTLLTRLIDYAGLFPPAGLSMPEAVHSFDDYLKGEMAWMLGHFVVPAARLSELASALLETERSRQWRLSCIVGDDLDADLREIERFSDQHNTADASVGAIEVKGMSSGSFDNRLSILCRDMAVYVEVPLEVSTEFLISIRRNGARAKIRMGGLTPTAIPPTRPVAEFLMRCAAAGAQFKATGGLHHPLRSWRPLTYRPDAPCAMMHGFLNFFLAAALAYRGESAPEILSVLDSEEAERFNFGEEEVKWNNRVLTNSEIEKARKGFGISFGSCSFEEPIQHLLRLSLL